MSYILICTYALLLQVLKICLGLSSSQVEELTYLDVVHMFQSLMPGLQCSAYVKFLTTVIDTDMFGSCSGCTVWYCTIPYAIYITEQYRLDVLWCQPIKPIQVVSTSEFHEY